MSLRHELARTASKTKLDWTAGEALINVYNENCASVHGARERDIERAHNVLSEIKKLRKEIMRLQEMHEQIIAGAEMRNSTPSGMPRGGCVDWTDAVDRAMEKAVEIEQAIECLTQRTRKIMEMIEKVKSLAERNVLIGQYVNNDTQTEIARAAGVAQCYISRIKRAGLVSILEIMERGVNDGRGLKYDKSGRILTAKQMDEKDKGRKTRGKRGAKKHRHINDLFCV